MDLLGIDLRYLEGISFRVILTKILSIEQQNAILLLLYKHNRM